MKKLKNKVVLAIVIVVVIIIALVIWFLATPKSNEEELKEVLIELGTDFYINYYYDSIEDKEVMLKSIEKNGISVNLDNLLIYKGRQNVEEEFINSLTGEECNIDETLVKIFPINNFEKMDFKIEVNLHCGF